MNKNIFALCITVVVVVFTYCYFDYQKSWEDSERVRNLLKLQRSVDPARLYAVPQAEKL